MYYRMIFLIVLFFITGCSSVDRFSRQERAYAHDRYTVWRGTPSDPGFIRWAQSKPL